MAKLFGLILIVMGVWVGIEVYDKGMDGAFGGAFAWVSAPLAPNETRSGSSEEPSSRADHSGSIAQRVGTKVQSDIDAGAHRDGAGDEEDND